MKALIVYDSVFGNTEKIARAIGGAIDGDVKVIRADGIKPANLELLDLLIVGAPTQGGRVTKPVRDFLNSIDEKVVKGISAAAFDTRSSTKWVGIFGYAAGRIAKSLQKIGANLVADPEGFFVTGTQGPLKEGEEERAAGWVKEIVKS
jgi:flavodoxin I